MKLWVANVVATLLVAGAVVLQLVAAASPACAPGCDPHGYLLIIVGFPAALGGLLALTAVGLLIARRRAGLWLALVVAGGCALQLLLLARLLPAGLIAAVGVLLIAGVVFATLGIRRVDLKSG
ncbi:hypothetical protein HPO96_15655 [Kribbella sandramycini]|uniref:O-antigen ligase n=1 Tax=Kribbella sandramycini TaxID=60450 RepID=A0A7Y4L1A3_9ACTN|nr:hypothetical protein [Kribbella sandramycini]MBB6565414.1 O-antigen ligase [Kribbella sandramycini]NOL41682.1 hypothetical protein [Kribbella sandramycini]